MPLNTPGGCPTCPQDVIMGGGVHAESLKSKKTVGPHADLQAKGGEIKQRERRPSGQSGLYRPALWADIPQVPTSPPHRDSARKAERYRGGQPKGPKKHSTQEERESPPPLSPKSKNNQSAPVGVRPTPGGHDGLSAATRQLHRISWSSPSP